MYIVENNYLKIVIFTAEKNHCMLHGGVFVMYAPAIKWTMNNFSSYTSVTDVQNQLCLRSLEQKRTGARLYLSILSRSFSDHRLR